MYPDKDLSRQEMLDLLENMAITATITSQEAIPRGTSRPVPLPSFNLNDDGCEPAPLRNWVDEICPLSLDPTVDPDKMDFETHIWLRDNNGGHPMRRITALLRKSRNLQIKGAKVVSSSASASTRFAQTSLILEGLLCSIFELGYR
jgi:hypothetical protein